MTRKATKLYGRLRRRKLRSIIIAAGLAFSLAGCGSADQSNEAAATAEAAVTAEVPRISLAQAMTIAHEAVASHLKDPDSAEFRNDHLGSYMGHQLVCGEVNSRNSFGGMTGYQRYVSDGGEATVLEEQMKPADFEQVWTGSACG